MSLTPPETVGKLQTALHTKAKNAPDYRFYALYDKLYRRDVLRYAFDRCRRNDGAPGVDRQAFRDIEEYGVDRWLDELTEELRGGTYQSQPVRRVNIPKDGQPGKFRPLGIPCIVEETDAKGDRHRTTRNKDLGMGTPQGSPISPLLSNLYMRRFVKGWRTGGHERRLDAHVVNYADDFVICCRGTADEAMTVMREMMSKLKLTVNEKKTRLCRLPEETFNFLGYTLGRNYDCRTGEPYLGPRPSRQKIARIGREIHELTTRRTTWLEVDELIRRINAKLRGWSNYFRIGTKSKAYRSIDTHVRQRVRQWLRAKFKVKGSAKQRYPDGYLYQKLGLVQLQ